MAIAYANCRKTNIQQRLSKKLFYVIKQNVKLKKIIVNC